MNNWQRKKLGDISSSCLGKMLDKEKNKGDLKPYLANINVRWGKFNLNKLQQMKFEDHEDSRYGLEYGDLIVCEGGEPGRCAIWRNEILNMKIQKALHRLRVKEGYCSEFLYYRMLLASKTEELKKYFIGSTIKHLTGVSLKQIEFDFPDIETQRKIGNLLRLLDQKIELNEKIFSKLDQCIRLIYDYWFIHFNFPNDMGKPYKSSGGEMLFSSELKREIPKYWSLKKLGSVISRSATGLNPRKNFVLGEGNNFYITIKNIEDGKIIFDDKCDRINDVAMEIINKRSDLSVGDVLFTSIQPVGLTYFISEVPNNWNINESVFTLRANQDLITQEYLYSLLSSGEIKNYTKNASTGSIHKGIRHAVLKEFIFAYGGKTVTEMYAMKIAPMLKKQFLIQQENLRLSKMRDFLLPLLMNGQISIRDAEEHIAKTFE